MALKAEPRTPAGLCAAERQPSLRETRPQFINIPNGDRLVVLAESDYNSMLNAARDNFAEADGAIEGAKVLTRLEGSEEKPIPFGILHCIAAGENRIKVLREWAGLTQAQLARAAGTAAGYISQLETGIARGGHDVLGKIAEAIGVPIELLLPKGTDYQFAFGIKVRRDGSAITIGTTGGALAFLDELPAAQKFASDYSRMRAAVEAAHESGNRLTVRTAEKMFKGYVARHFG